VSFMVITDSKTSSGYTTGKNSAISLPGENHLVTKADRGRARKEQRQENEIVVGCSGEWLNRF
jgi:hypothetical protein